MEAYLPAIPTIAQDLNTTIVQVNLTISTFLLGMAIGQLLGGPLSDQAGRRKNVLFGHSLFLLSSLGILFSQNIEQIQFLRFTQALGTGFASIVVIPTIRDIYEPLEAAKKIPLMMTAMMIAPMVAPVFGTVLLQWHWRAIFVFLLVVGIAVLMVYFRKMPETRAQTHPVSLLKIITQYRAVAKHRVNNELIGIKYVFLSAFATGPFFIFLTNASWVYIEYFKVNELLFPLYFAAVGTIFLVANLVATRLMAYFDPQKILKVSALAQPISLAALLLLAWMFDINIVVFIAVLALTLGSSELIRGCAMGMLLGYFHALAGSVLSLVRFVGFILGAALGSLSSLLFDGTLLPMVAIMLLSSSSALLLVRLLPDVTLAEVSRQPRQEGI